MARKAWGTLGAALAILMLPLVAASPLGADTFVVASESPGGGWTYVGDAVADITGTLTFLNAGLPAHDVVSIADGPSTNPWCARFANRVVDGVPHGCPLFASRLIGTGQQAVVQGTNALPELASYEFYCTTHPFMRATLTTV